MKWITICLVILVPLLAVTTVGPVMSDTELPEYKVLLSEKNIELRQYAPMIIAEVEVQGERKNVISSGFRPLADYIFGNNTAQNDITMTAPVQQQESVKNSMTAPVQEQISGNSWKISFVMPSEYSIGTLPKPNNQQVMLKEIPGKKYIVITFSGFNSDSNISRHEKQLMDYIWRNQIEITSTPKYAYYNPPWTLPFMRRNEVMIEISNQE